MHGAKRNRRLTCHALPSLRSRAGACMRACVRACMCARAKHARIPPARTLAGSTVGDPLLLVANRFADRGRVLLARDIRNDARRRSPAPKKRHLGDTSRRGDRSEIDARKHCVSAPLAPRLRGLRIQCSRHSFRDSPFPDLTFPDTRPARNTPAGTGRNAEMRVESGGRKIRIPKRFEIRFSRGS